MKLNGYNILTYNQAHRVTKRSLRPSQTEVRQVNVLSRAVDVPSADPSGCGTRTQSTYPKAIVLRKDTLCFIGDTVGPDADVFIGTACNA